MGHHEWEMNLTEIVSNKLGCDYGDASGILEARPFEVTQAWVKGLNPAEAFYKLFPDYTG